MVKTLDNIAAVFLGLIARTRAFCQMIFVYGFTPTHHEKSLLLLTQQRYLITSGPAEGYFTMLLTPPG